MFDFVHNNKKLVRLFMALIILPFAFWGIDSYNRAGDAGVAAIVNGEKITQQEFENALRQQQQRLREQLGANFDASILDAPEMKRAVLDNLVGQRLLIERAKSAGLVVTDDQVARIVSGVDAFKSDGKFDKARYREALARQNITPIAFEARLRNDILGQLMQEGYAQNGFVSNTVVDNVIKLNEQQRVVRVSTILSKQYEAKAEVSDSDVRDYFEQNSQEFLVQERAKVEYVTLSVDSLLPKVVLEQDEVRNYYRTHESEFGDPEVRRAAHILINVTSSAPDAEQSAAREKAEKLLQQAKTNPAGFAELAKENSQDTGSASSGGDLGFFGRGMMVKPFEDAVFSMRVGEISGLVKSDFGYHIIKLTGINPSKAMPFEKVREGIASRLKQQKASDMFAELAEKFSNVVYEQSDTLQPAAELVGAKIERSGWLTRKMGADELWTADLMQAIFSDEVAKGKRNTAAVEVGPSKLVAARVVEYKPSVLREFSEVKKDIRNILLKRRAVELANSYGETALASMRAGDKSSLVWGKVQNITRGNYGSLDASLVKEIFRADAEKFPQYVGAKTNQGDYVIARIEGIKSVDDIDEAKRARYSQQLRRLTGEVMAGAYLADAKQDADIVLKLPTAAIDPRN